MPAIPVPDDAPDWTVAPYTPDDEAPEGDDHDCTGEGDDDDGG